MITTSQWGAESPDARDPARRSAEQDRLPPHGRRHAPSATLEGAKAYARAIQNDHMHRNPPFSDSGHNFLATRSGTSWRGPATAPLAAIRDGAMVSSAHCVGQNGNPGIEHEHVTESGMTPAQREASLELHAFICRRTGVSPDQVLPHRQFNNTECPGELKLSLQEFRAELKQRLAA